MVSCVSSVDISVQRGKAAPAESLAKTRFKLEAKSREVRFSEHGFFNREEIRISQFGYTKPSLRNSRWPHFDNLSAHSYYYSYDNFLTLLGHSGDISHTPRV